MAKSKRFFGNFKSRMVFLALLILFLGAYGQEKPQKSDDLHQEKSKGVESQESKFAKNAMYVVAQIGVNSYVREADANALPKHSLPFPIGASCEFILTRNLGIGGSCIYDEWSDTLGLYSGWYYFHLVKPSFDVTYHFRLKALKGLDFLSGTSIGYNILSVRNQLGNKYEGKLHSEPLLAPFLGVRLCFWENLASFLRRLSITSKVAWSVMGNFSGLYGSVGFAYRIN